MKEKQSSHLISVVTKGSKSLKKKGGKKNKGSSFADALRSLDMFGLRIGMTYEGNDNFRTLFGAILSIIVSIIITAFVVYKMELMLARQDAKTSRQTFIQKLADTPPFYIH